MFKSALVTTDGSDIAASVLPHVAHVTAPDGKVTVVAVIDDASKLIAQMTPAGFKPARRARSTDPSVWPVRTRTPPPALFTIP